MRTRGKMTNYNVGVVTDAIKASGISPANISKMVLGKSESYIRQSYCKCAMNVDDLKKLCDFLSIRYSDVAEVDTAETVVSDTKTQAQVDPKAIDTLIVGLNSIIELEKANNNLLTELLKELKVSNTKAGRFENIMGQVHSNILVLKESMSKDVVPYLRDTKTATATMSGRMKELLAKFK